MEILQYLIAFVVTLGVLVSVHELGHFLVARASGAHVIRFCIGFGPVIASRFDRRGTEFAVAAIPLGGYVRILDEREDEVPPELEARTFNRLSPLWRIGFALGGPLANFVLAFVVYWGLFVAGSTDVVPIIAAPAAGTPAAEAGLAPDSEIVSIDGTATPTWADVSMALAARLGDTGTISVVSRTPGSPVEETHRIRIEDWQRGVAEPDLGSLGLKQTLPAVFGEVLDKGPAHDAGLERYDRVIAVDGHPIVTWGDWVDAVRAAPGKVLSVEIERGGSKQGVSLTPAVHDADGGKPYGYVGVAPLLREISHGVFASVPLGLHETAAKTALTFELLGKMVTGMVSTRNLSGPITIAKVAGDSARFGGLHGYLAVLALLSISLGVLNLLPIPILDGGHVVFYATELVLGRPVPDRIQTLGMQVGLAIVGGMVLLAFYNDITRLF